MALHLGEWLDSYPTVKAQLEFVLISLRRMEISGAHPCAKATIEVLRNALSNGKFTSTAEMMLVVRALGKELAAAVPCELTVGNLVRRVLFVIREEYTFKAKSTASSLTVIVKDKPKADGQEPIVPRSVSLGKLLAQTNAEAETEYSLLFPEMRSGIVAAVNELYDEIDNIYLPICEQAAVHIHADECILVYGYSVMIDKFLRAAAKKRRFFVVVAEDAPSLEGHKLAAVLSKVENIAVTLIPDSNIYALMARVNKVIFSPMAVMADGGAICSSGHLMVAAAAKEHAVPVVGLTSAFMLTPLFAHNQETVLNQLKSPEGVIPYHAPVDLSRKVEIMLPAYDFLPPDVVTLYVTNNGSHLPSYMYRQLSEYYHIKDHELS